MKSIKSLKESYSIINTIENYYIIVTDQGTLNDFDETFKILE